MLKYDAISLEDVWNATFDSLLMTSLEGKIVSMNRSAQRLFSENPSRITGISIQDLIQSDEFTLDFIKKDRSGIPISLGTQQLLANIKTIPSSSDPTNILFILKNMTPLKKLNYQLDQLSEHKLLFDSMLDSLEEGICAIDKQGKVIFYNKKMGEIDSLEPESVKNKHLLEAMPFLEEISSTLFNALNTAKIFTQRETHFTNSGKEITTVSKTLPLVIGDKNYGAIEVVKDISEHRKITELLEKMKNEDIGEIDKAYKSTNTNNTRFHFKDIIYSSREMRQTVNQAIRASNSISNILIYGETGTGKELFAQSIHNQSSRKQKPFVAQNCAAIPENLLEGILFGTNVGGFTGAVDHPGLFEQAQGGTILLDEINAMSINLQAKLLRVLQERKIQRLGSTKLLDINVRVIATINEDPHVMINDGRLREDLYYRLGVVNLSIPPLRKRKEDIDILIDYFIEKHSKALDVSVQGIEKEVYDFFIDYQWPGNVRQLEHTIEGSLNFITDEIEISFSHLPNHLKSKIIQHEAKEVQSPPTTQLDFVNGTLTEQLEQLEHGLIEKALKECNGNITKASERLGISRQNLNYKLKKYNIR